MKRSLYNIFVDLDDGTKIAFNSKSCSLAVADNEFMDVVNNIEKVDYNALGEEDKLFYDDLILGNYILKDDEIDELKAMEFRHYMGKYNGNHFGLTIAPTLACNFKCTYCFESPKEGIMGEDIQQAVIDWVKEAARMRKKIYINWFGGEPLLAKEVVYKMSEKIVELCEEYECEYTLFMVTNGYLIDDEVISELKRVKVSGMQITVDGPAHIHDTRRILKGNGGGTFDRLLENIIKLRENNFSVNIRINVDKSNNEYVGEFLDVLEAKGLKDVPLNLGLVTSFNDTCKKVSSTCFTGSEFAKVDSEFYNDIFSRKITKREAVAYPNLKGSFCSCDHINSFVVDSEGYLYKCWSDIGEIPSAIGNIKDLDMNNIEMTKNMIKYMTWTPFNFKECVECSYLPICMGGCPYVGTKNNKPECEKWKYNIKEMLKLKLLSSSSMAEDKKEIEQPCI